MLLSTFGSCAVNFTKKDRSNLEPADLFPTNACSYFMAAWVGSNDKAFKLGHTFVNSASKFSFGLSVAKCSTCRRPAWGKQVCKQATMCGGLSPTEGSNARTAHCDLAQTAPACKPHRPACLFRQYLLTRRQETTLEATIDSKMLQVLLYMVLKWKARPHTSRSIEVRLAHHRQANLEGAIHRQVGTFTMRNCFLQQIGPETLACGR